MLDPYVRRALAHNGEGTFSLQFKVPDVYGVFKYVVDYRRRGYSHIGITKARGPCGPWFSASHAACGLARRMGGVGQG